MLVFMIWVVIPSIIGLAMFGIAGMLIFGLVLGPLLWLAVRLAIIDSQNPR
jgi:hypothetical protein